MRITTLVENNAMDGRDDLTPEFGLSLLIETGPTTVLFDTGASGVFVDNARR
jgi:7,8-dihydropterin-6-yl-methyl-4-(beta-D-ribofuranosyl)aminobenzene 5'-phosphate synthase